MAGVNMFQYWFFVILFLLPLICGRENPCYNDESENVQVEDLIKTSPVILKALGARIFPDITSDYKLKTNNNGDDEKNKDRKNSDGVFVQAETSNSPKSTLITLTPQSVYKGSSILKSASSRTTEGSNNDSGKEYCEYDGQLNASLKSIECLNMKILRLLPIQLIVFGTLDAADGEKGGGVSQSDAVGYERKGSFNSAGTFGGSFNGGGGGGLSSENHDILRISAGGLHKWSAQLERTIWKYLGWDDWSDFTPCSISCGKGVQQRFRRCLLDKPNLSITESKSSTSSNINDYDEDGCSRSNINDRKNGNNILTYHQLNAHGKHRSHKKDVSLKRAKKRRKKKGLEGQKGLVKGQKLSTLSCEGYNIEQRDCNMFDCSDDIIDLLKFYKKSFSSVNDTAGIFNFSETTVDGLTTSSSSISISSSTTSGSTNGGGGSSNGYVQNWINSLNFTIMITLKVKNPSQSTIFSLRNFSSNLYLDQNQDGFKLYQERDDLSEMLPIKLNLFDNHWHQISISVSNGDFISVHVDCNWMSSFVVSKHLLFLPNGADVEIGRGFNGDIQQLLIMPGLYDKQQCSSNTTSINEVKRYIIDTFIDEDDLGDDIEKDD